MQQFQERHLTHLAEKALSDGFRCLRFSKDLETGYLNAVFAARRRILRWGAVGSILLVVGALLVDYAMLPDQMALAVVLRVGVYVPVMLASLCLVRFAPSPRLPDLLIAANGMLIAWLTTYLSIKSHSALNLQYLVMLNAVVVYTSILGRFWPLALTSAFAAACLVQAVRVIGQPLDAIGIGSCLLLGSTIVFALYGNYVLEHASREAYLVDIQEDAMDRELAQTHESLAQMVRMDPLTQLSNRRHFDEFLQEIHAQAVQRKETMALMLIDIDHFKAYNDHYGHPAGDQCLRAVADAIRGSVRTSGDLVARWGGEEFAVVMGNACSVSAKHAASRILDAVRGAGLSHAKSATAATVTVSIGLSLQQPHTDSSPQDVIDAADKALYLAKSQGRNRAVLDTIPVTHDLGLAVQA